MIKKFLTKMAAQAPMTADLLVPKIYNLLEENIVSMTLPPETKLVEENIARALGVSRSPVREALIQLENAGLVVRKTGKGRVVGSFTEQGIIDHYELWEMVEGFAGGLACLTASEEDFRNVEAVLDKMSDFSRSEGNSVDYRQINYSFHYSMVRPCPNQTLVKLYENTLRTIKWCWNLSMFMQRTVASSHDEHRQIYEAYRQRDRIEYEKRIRRHIHEASERFRVEYKRRKRRGVKQNPLSSPSIDHPHAG